MNTPYSIRIREIRQKNKLTQTEFAFMIGTTKNQLSKYETGVQEIPTKIIIAVCQKFNVSADWLLGLRETILTTEFDPSFKAIMVADIETPAKGAIIIGKTKKKEEKPIIKPLTTATADE